MTILSELLSPLPGLGQAAIAFLVNVLIAAIELVARRDVADRGVQPRFVVMRGVIGA